MTLSVPLNEDQPDPDVMDRVVRYIPAIRREAQKVWASHPRHAWMDVDDLVSVGIIAAIQASHRYDPGTGTGFYLFMLPRVRGALLDMYRRKRLVDLQSCESVGTSRDLEGRRHAVEPDIDERIFAREKRELCARALESLEREERQMVVSCKLQGKSLVQVAREHGLSVQRTRKVVEGAMETVSRLVRKGGPVLRE